MRGEHLARSHTTEAPEAVVAYSLMKNHQLVQFLVSLIRADEIKTARSLLASARDLDQLKTLPKEIFPCGSIRYDRVFWNAPMGQDHRYT